MTDSKVKEHPLFARFYELASRGVDRGWEGDRRNEAFGAASGRVLEIGAGNGLNFGRLAAGDRVVGLEPEPNMLRRARPRAAGAPVRVYLVAGIAEALPFRDGAFDTVACSLVLCSVSDLPATLDECRRVLSPGGRLLFYEHVRSIRPNVARWQDRLERPWGVIGAGCHPNRDTPAALIAGGFVVRVRRFRPPTPGGWFLPHVLGEARPAATA